MSYLHELFGIKGDWERGGNYFFLWRGCVVVGSHSAFWSTQFDRVPEGTVCYSVPTEWFDWHHGDMHGRIEFNPDPDFETRLVTGMILGEVERRVK